MDESLEIKIIINGEEYKAVLSSVKKDAEKIKKDFEKTSNEVDKTAGNVKKVDRELKKARGSSKKFLSDFEKAVIVLNQGFELMRKMQSFGRVLAKPFAEAGQFEQYRMTLKNLLGDIDIANNRFKEMVEFAAVTPFNVPGIVEAGNRLQTLGRYSLETIRMLGDLAAASGKDVSQAVEAYTNLITGRTGFAIKQFRTMLISTSDWTNEIGKSVLKTGKGATASIEEMLDALPKILARKNFIGLMDQQSKTLLGQISNLEDAWQQFLATLGDQRLDEGKAVISALGDAVDFLTVKSSNLIDVVEILIGALIALGSIKLGSGLFSILVSGKITAIIGAIVAVSAAIGILYALLKDTNETMIEENNMLIKNTKAEQERIKILKSSATVTRDLLDERLKLLSVNDRTAESAKKLEENENALRELLPDLIDDSGKFTDSTERLKEEFVSATEKAKSYEEQLKDLDSAIRRIELTNKQLEANISFENFRNEVKDAVLEIDGLNGAIEWMYNLLADMGIYNTATINKSKKITDKYFEKIESATSIEELNEFVNSITINIETLNDTEKDVADKLYKLALQNKGDSLKGWKETLEFYSNSTEYSKAFTSLIEKGIVKVNIENKKQLENQIGLLRKHIFGIDEYSFEKELRELGVSAKSIDNVRVSFIKALEKQRDFLLSSAEESKIEVYDKFVDVLKERLATDQNPELLLKELENLGDSITAKVVDVFGEEFDFVPLVKAYGASVLKPFRTEVTNAINIVQTRVEDYRNKLEAEEKAKLDRRKSLYEEQNNKFLFLQKEFNDRLNELEESGTKDRFEKIIELINQYSSDIESLREETIKEYYPKIMADYGSLDINEVDLKRKMSGELLKATRSISKTIQDIFDREAVKFINITPNIKIDLEKAFKNALDEGGIMGAENLMDSIINNLDIAKYEKDIDIELEFIGKVDEKNNALLASEKEHLEKLKGIYSAYYDVIRDESYTIEEMTILDEVERDNARENRLKEASKIALLLKKLDLDIAKNLADTDEMAVRRIQENWRDIEYIVSNTLHTIGDLMQTITDNNIRNIEREGEAWKDAQYKKIDAQQEFASQFARTSNQQQMLEEYYQKRKESVDLAVEKRVNEAKKRQFELNKAIKIAEAGMNIASAIIEHLATPWMIPFISALGAVQLGIILSTEYPGYSEGGYTGDKDEKEVAGVTHGKEFVMHARATKKYRPILEKLNSNNDINIATIDSKGKVIDGIFNNAIDKSNSYVEDKSYSSLLDLLNNGNENSLYGKKGLIDINKNIETRTISNNSESVINKINIDNEKIVNELIASKKILEKIASKDWNISNRDSKKIVQMGLKEIKTSSI